VEVDSLRAYVSDPVSAKVELLGADGRVELAPKTITVAFSRTVRDLEAPLVDVGDADSLPELDPQSGERLALVAGSGESRARLQQRLQRDRPRHWHAGPDEAWKLQQLGAVGAVFINPHELLQRSGPHDRLGNPLHRNAHRIPQLPIAEGVRAMATRSASASPPAAPSAPPRAAQRRDTDGMEAPALAVARIPAGLNPSSDAPYVLFGATSTPGTRAPPMKPQRTRPMLEMARAFYKSRAQLRRDPSSRGGPATARALRGSTWFADHRYAELRIARSPTSTWI
jgi:hypothetical protein